MHSAIKARQCRYLAPVALKLCKDYHNEANQYSKHRLACLENLNIMYDLVDPHPVFCLLLSRLSMLQLWKSFCCNIVLVQELLKTLANFNGQWYLSITVLHTFQPNQKCRALEPFGLMVVNIWLVTLQSWLLAA